MKPSRWAARMLAAVLLVSSIGVWAAELTPAEAAAPSALGLSAQAALIPADSLYLDGQSILLLERGTGTMLYAKDPDARREPASVTKVMTCLLAMEYGGLSEQVTVTESALANLDPDGSAAGLRPGEVYTLEELLYCLMVASANDAALVIAEYVGGSQAGFVEMMNQRAQELGCQDTHFANPHGMHDDQHYTTARDLARIFSAALEYDLFWSLFSTTHYEIPRYDDTGAETDPLSLDTTNYLLSTRVTDEYYDPRILGGKTGFTTPAGRCIACVGEVGELSCLAVVLGASAWDDQGQADYANFTTASALMDLAEGLSAVTVAATDAVYSISVPYGAQAADGGLETDVMAILPADHDPEALSFSLLAQDGLAAPLDGGDLLGQLQVCYGGTCVATAPLYALEPVGYAAPSPSPSPTLPPRRAGIPWNCFPRAA